MRRLGPELGVPIHVYGPEAHITAIVPLALGLPLDENMKMTSHVMDTAAAGTVTSPMHDSRPASASGVAVSGAGAACVEVEPAVAATYTQFSSSTRCIVYGMQTRAVQVCVW